MTWDGVVRLEGRTLQVLAAAVRRPRPRGDDATSRADRPGRRGAGGRHRAAALASLRQGRRRGREARRDAPGRRIARERDRRQRAGREPRGIVGPRARHLGHGRAARQRPRSAGARSRRARAARSPRAPCSARASSSARGSSSAPGRSSGIRASAGRFGAAGAVRAVPQLGGVVIEDDVVIGPLSTVDAGTWPYPHPPRRQARCARARRPQRRHRRGRRSSPRSAASPAP